MINFYNFLFIIIHEINIANIDDDNPIITKYIDTCKLKYIMYWNGIVSVHQLKHSHLFYYLVNSN